MPDGLGARGCSRPAAGAATAVSAAAGELGANNFRPSACTPARVIAAHNSAFAINASRLMGHLSGAGATVPENELQNREISAFLDIVTAHGKGIP